MKSLVIIKLTPEEYLENAADRVSFYFDEYTTGSHGPLLYDVRWFSHQQLKIEQILDKAVEKATDKYTRNFIPEQIFGRGE